MSAEAPAPKPLSALKPGSLSEARLRRKFAKLLGLNPAASWERIQRAVQGNPAFGKGSGGNPTLGPLARTPSDLHELLGQLLAMQPVCKGLKLADRAPKLELPQPLEAVRSASEVASRSGCVATAIQAN